VPSAFAKSARLSGPAAARRIPWRDLQYQTMPAAAEILGVSVATIYRFATEGRLTLVKIGGRTQADTAGLIAILDQAEPWTPSSRADKARSARAERSRANWQG